MKKYLAVLISALFILSFAATAFAVHETTPPEEAVVAQGPAKITLGGKLIMRGWYFNNVGNVAGVSNALPVDTGSDALYTTNAYITVDAKIGNNIQGFMELETSARDNENSGVAYWGTYDTKNDTVLKFRQLWMQYTGSGLLGAPAGLKAGHMMITLGEKQFLNNERFGNDAILLWVDPIKELHLLVGTTKLNESQSVSVGSINHTEDLDGYVALLTYMLNKDNTIGVNYVLAHSDGNLPSLSDPSDIEGTVPNCETLNFQNVGIHANGKIMGLSYAAEADMNFGKAEDVLGGGDAKFKGWGVFAKVGYMLDPVNIRASFAMGSGDDGFDNIGAGEGDLVDDILAGNVDIEEFQTLQGTDAIGAITRLTHYTQIYERTVRTAAAEAVVSTFPGGNVRTTGIANTTYFNLGFDVNPVKEVSISVDGFLLYATETGLWEDLDLAGTGGDVSDEVGWEIDSKFNWKIAKNLSYFIEAAIFKPGDFYQDAFGDNVDETVKQAVHGLLLTF